MCMQIKGDEGEFAASGEIRVEANKRAGRGGVGCCQSPPFQLHIYEFDFETRCRDSRKSEISCGSFLLFSFRDVQTTMTRSEMRTMESRTYSLVHTYSLKIFGR